VSGASQTRAYLALLAIVALWGSFPANTKLALADFPPFFLAAIRCTVAACLLLVLLARSPSETIRGLGPGAVKAFLILGAAGIWGSMQFTYLAIYYTTAGNAVILQGGDAHHGRADRPPLSRRAAPSADRGDRAGPAPPGGAHHDLAGRRNELVLAGLALTTRGPLARSGAS
jgi:hypothetical protein